jgi:hypothetical protein
MARPEANPTQSSTAHGTGIAGQRPSVAAPGSGQYPSTGAPTKAEDVASTPGSVPPLMPSLAPPLRPSVPASGVDLSAQHPWLANPRLALLRRSISDEHLVGIHSWGIDPTWTTNQIAGHVHAALPKKEDRKMFETLLVKCEDKAALMELVYTTLAAQPPEVAQRHARMRDPSR